MVNAIKTWWGVIHQLVLLVSFGVLPFAFLANYVGIPLGSAMNTVVTAVGDKYKTAS